jgi:glycosyltransferase involved in cell wall biosynthesis
MNSVVSIITPSFNRADIVHETAQSIFNQTYPHWEWVIVDDGSTDNSLEVLQQFAAKDERVKILQRNRDPKGACTCRNIAVENCKGDYVLFLDTDDLLASFCLEQRVKAAAENPDCDFVIFPMLLFKNHPDDLQLLWNINNDDDDIDRILSGDPVCQGTGPLWKKSSFVRVGMWSEQLLLWQDIELHLRSLLMGVKYTKRFDLEPDIFLRVSDVSLSRTGYHSLPKLQSRMQVLKETVGRMQQKNIYEKYRKGIRHMFTDLYINAVNSRHTQEVAQMLQWQKDWRLFTDDEAGSFKRYAAVQKYRLYKIPFIQNFMLGTLQKLAGKYNSKVSTIRYDKKIKV